MTVAEDVQPETGDIHRMTVDEYVHIVNELGWQRTELVEGVVYDVSPSYGLHTRTVMHVFRQIDAHLSGGATFNVGSVQLGPRTLVEPDVYVVTVPDVVTDLAPTPGAAVTLAVEVSVTTHAYDRGPKLTAYANAGVPEVWLIDPRPESGQLLRHRHPDGSSYRTVDTFPVGEGAAALDVSGLLA